MYSGKTAAAVYARLEPPETLVILGPNHHGVGAEAAVPSHARWETPLGAVEIDGELAAAIRAASRTLQVDDAAHAREHSIEVQLPFLQYFKPDFKLVPIVFGHPSGAIYKEVGKEIARAVKELGRGVVIIASSDMSHYEPQASAQNKDQKAIEAVLNLDEDELLKRVAKFNITMCGYAPAVSLIVAAKELGATGAELVKYQTSGDVTGDYSAVVGYAGIIIKGPSAEGLFERRGLRCTPW
jgi:hypothetical protein